MIQAVVLNKGNKLQLNPRNVKKTQQMSRKQGRNLTFHGSVKCLDLIRSKGYSLGFKKKLRKCVVELNVEIYMDHNMSEAEKPRRLVSIANRKVFARPERFCACLQIGPKNKSGKISDSLESFCTVWKISGQSGKFLDSQESFQSVEKVSGLSGKFPDSLESFQTVL